MLSNIRAVREIICLKTCFKLVKFIVSCLIEAVDSEAVGSRCLEFYNENKSRWFSFRSHFFNMVTDLLEEVERSHSVLR